jgi:hypothetical protein
MQANSFVRRQLRATFTLGGSGAVFPGTNNNVLVVTGLRMSAQVQATARLASQMSLAVQGMKRADMDAITVAWSQPPIVFDHFVLLEANNGNGWSKVFSGTITDAQPEYRGAPDTFLSVVAVVGYFQKIAPVEPRSYTETVEIGLVAGDIADAMGFEFVNGGANAVLAGPIYLHGTLVDQLDTACQMAGCDYYLQGNQGERGKVTITPRGRPIEGAPVAVRLSKDTGLIGYPVYERYGLNVQALYQPAFTMGVPIDVESIAPAATGRWYPYSMTHNLESNTRDGKWQTDMKCLRVGFGNG